MLIVFSNNDLRSSELDTLHFMKYAVLGPYVEFKVKTTASPALELRSETMILHPNSAKRDDTSFPNPDAPPVTIATYYYRKNQVD